MDAATRSAAGGREVWRQDVTKEQATRWLLQRDEESQRSLNEGVAKRYLSDMNAGKWQPWVEQIAFDTDERLINGQHVLWALIRSEPGHVPLIVQIGLPPEAFAGFDKNRKRSARDDLKVQGVEKPGEVAAVATVIWQWERGFFNGTGWNAARGGEQFPTAAQVCECVDLHPGIHQHLVKLPAVFRGKAFALGAFRAGSYLLHQIDERRAAKFFRSLIEGIDLPSKDHPVAVLRDEFLSLRHGERLRNGETLARIVKAWQMYTRGENVLVNQALIRKTDHFPELKALTSVN
jgi:hypothetical protein